MRVLLVADTHGAIDPRIVAVARRCDLVVHAGDVGAAHVLDALGEASELVAIRGNNDVADKWPAEDRDALDALPHCAAIALPGGRLITEHGDSVAAAHRHRRLRRRHADARAVLYGHSHRLARDTRARPWVLNPGAAGRTRTHGGPSCLILVAGRDRWRLQARRFER